MYNFVLICENTILTCIMLNNTVHYYDHYYTGTFIYRSSNNLLVIIIMIIMIISKIGEYSLKILSKNIIVNQTRIRENTYERTRALLPMIV